MGGRLQPRWLLLAAAAAIVLGVSLAVLVYNGLAAG